MNVNTNALQCKDKPNPNLTFSKTSFIYGILFSFFWFLAVQQVHFSLCLSVRFKTEFLPV